jgi:ligand-binding sensor domain-containing protein
MKIVNFGKLYEGEEPMSSKLHLSNLHSRLGVLGVLQKFILSLLLLNLPGHAIGNSFGPSFLHLGKESGLPSDLVFDIFQDTQGYIWISTDGGVSRFDGYFFENFSIADGLTDHEVLGVREDSKGRLWMMTLSGVPCFYKNGKFHNPENTLFLKRIGAKGFHSAFYEDQEMNLYLGYYDGSIVRIDSSDNVSQLPCTEMCHQNRKRLPLSSQPK